MRLHKQLVDSGEEYAGCLSALVSVLGLHVRHSSQRLLSNRKHQSRRHSGNVVSRRSLDFPRYTKKLQNDIEDVDKTGAKLVGLCKSSSNNLTRRPSTDLDLAAFIVEFSTENYHYQEGNQDDSIWSCEHSSPEKALGNMAEVLQHQNFIDSKLSINGQDQSKESADALDILNSNNELFPKLVPDAKSLILEHIQNLQDAPHRNKFLQENVGSLGQDQVPVHQESFKKKIRHNLFRKKDESKAIDSSQAISKIVVLKPSPKSKQNASTSKSSSSLAQSYPELELQENSKRPNSKFSFKNFKSRLTQAIGESRKKIDKKCKTKEIGLSILDESYFYEQAKKHLAEMLAAVDEMDSLRNKEVLEPLSSPEYGIVTFSRELDSSPNQMRLLVSPEFVQENYVDSFSPLRHSFGCSTTCSIGNVQDEIQVTDPNWNKHDIESENGRAEGYCTLEPEPSDDKLEVPITPASISRILDIKEMENLEEFLENPERPSPVSILEVLLSEDTIGLESAPNDYGDFPQQPKQLHSEEHGSSSIVQSPADSEGSVRNLDILGFVTALLEASGLRFNEISERWHLSDQLLGHPLLKEVGMSLSDDPYVLFDCINEVLAETHEALYGCTPWVSLIKHDTQPITRRGKPIEEVCKGIGMLLHDTWSPNILNELEIENWTDRSESEHIGFEMADAILEEVMDKTVFELWALCAIYCEV